LGLKPDNVLLCGTGEVKLSDFRVKNCPVECMCKEGTFFYYKAPEAFAKETEKTVDGRADIWALGCIIHEMITFRRTFEIDAITLSH
jgi:serine/threonine-protein kinase